ncbi:leukocyte elastase inhibitor A-like isoform X2 [Cataglyphis hispanica]|uniref:leukocyte elastase inhibitor A-like isoform X2 n=1 Tax=Cataglyphis hispanica TaxID=1086592 RepID=UPI002180311F|nr:leukocyte elastase inhibitor A-like isoform X2 [Cataglyphis hispanica]
MVRIWLTFGLLILAGGQIVYPDQYQQRMTFGTSRAPAPGSQPANYPALQTVNNSQSVQIKQSNQESAPQSDVAGRGTAQINPSTQLPFYPSISPTANLTASPLLENWGDHVNNIIARGIMKFSLDLNKAIYNTKDTSMANHRENVIFSPLSVAVALSLILLGSAGRTFNEVSHVLGLESGIDISQHSEIVHQTFGQLLDIANFRIEGSNKPRVDSASGVFIQEGYPIRPEFRAISTNVYKSEVINLDFEKKGKEAEDIINNWVKQRTMGKIDGILNSVPDPTTMVILLSALYFKGEWNQHFLEGMTQRKQFFIEPNETIGIDMMYNGGNFPFYEDKSLGVKILALPYKGLEMSMYVLLPKVEGATALKNFQDQLTVETIENLISNLKNQTCIIGFPRMKLSSTLSLNSALQNLGLRSLFDAKTADLSLLSSGYGQNAAAAPTLQVAPHISRQVFPEQLSSKTNDYLIFSRMGDNQDVSNGARANFFRTRRESNVLDEKQHNVRSSRTMYATENDGLEKDTKISHENTRYVNLEENKYRFQNAEKKTKNRKRRQSRPIDENFLRFMQSKNFPSYGLDALRNSANLVNPGLFADEVLHKVEMDVTEKGTEAAATTGILLRRDGNQKKLIANRPFLFFIRHDPTKLILFWGTVNAPVPNYAVVR